MNTFKKALSVAVISGLGLGFIPAAKATEALDKMSTGRKVAEAWARGIVPGVAGLSAAGIHYLASTAILTQVAGPIPLVGKAIVGGASLLTGYFVFDAEDEAADDRWNNMGLDAGDKETLIEDYVLTPILTSLVGIFCTHLLCQSVTLATLVAQSALQ